MGDSGSMLIGLVLSASAITLTGQFSADRAHRQVRPARTASLLPTLLPLLLPVSILLVPMLDLVLAVVRRTQRGPLAVSRPTSSTCTTGCWRSATPTAGRWRSCGSGRR